MAYPVVEATSTGVIIALNTATHAITLPTGVVENDLLVVYVSNYGMIYGHTYATVNKGLSSSNWYGPINSGYQGTGYSGHSIHMSVFVAYASGGSNALSIDTSWIAYSKTHPPTTIYTKPSYICYRISGVLKQDVISRSFTQICDNANGANWNHRQVPAIDDSIVCDYLWILTVAAPANVVASVVPTSFANLITAQGSGMVIGATSLSSCRRTTNSVSVLDPGAFTAPSCEWYGNLARITPAGGSSGDPIPPSTSVGVGTYIYKLDSDIYGTDADFIDILPVDLKFHFDGTPDAVNPYQIYVQVLSSGSWTAVWNAGTYFTAGALSGVAGITYVAISCVGNNDTGASYTDALVFDGPGITIDSVNVEQYATPL
jgi:hypothetical protein